MKDTAKKYTKCLYMMYPETDESGTEDRLRKTMGNPLRFL